MVKPTAKILALVSEFEKITDDAEKGKFMAKHAAKAVQIVNALQYKAHEAQKASAARRGAVPIEQRLNGISMTNDDDGLTIVIPNSLLDSPGKDKFDKDGNPDPKKALFGIQSTGYLKIGGHDTERGSFVINLTMGRDDREKTAKKPTHVPYGETVGGETVET